MGGPKPRAQVELLDGAWFAEAGGVARVGVYPILRCSTARPLHTRFLIIFSRCFAKVTIGFVPRCARALQQVFAAAGGRTDSIQLRRVAVRGQARP